MTLIVSAHGQDFVVLGSDTRGTDQWRDGSRVEVNVVQKVWPAGKYVRVLLCGDGDYAFNLYDIFRTRHGVNHADVRGAASHLAEVGREDAKLLRGVPGAFGEGSGVGFIVTGLDFQKGTATPVSFRITSDTGFKLELMQLGYCIDGKSHIPKYLFAKHYHPPMILDDLSRLVAHAVFEVGSVDSDVGGTVEVAVIDRSGVRTLTEKAVKDMIASPIVSPPEEDKPIEDALGIRRPSGSTTAAPTLNAPRSPVAEKRRRRKA